MTLESGRAVMHGVMILVFTAIAAWVSQPVGLALLAVVGILRIQESATNWCPSDLFLKPLGFKSRAAAKS